MPIFINHVTKIIIDKYNWSFNMTDDKKIIRTEEEKELIINARKPEGE